MKERTLPIYIRDIGSSVFEQYSVFPGGMMARGQTFWGRPIPGGLWYLQRKLASDTPIEADL